MDSPMFWALAPKHVHLLPAVFFEFHLEDRWGILWGMDVQLGDELNANNDK